MNNLPEYLLKPLNEIAVENEFIEFNLNVDSGSKHGDGFLADMIRVTISGTKKQLNGEIKLDKLALICKTVPTNTARREFFNSEKIFANEIFAYNNVFPVLKEFQKEKGILDADGFTQFAHAYRAIKNANPNQNVIIMEDLTANGYSVWNKLEPYTYEHVRLLMIALGRYHGLSFALRDQKPEIFDSFRILTDLFYVMTKESDGLRSLFTSGFDKAIRLFDGKREAEIFTEHKENLLEIFETLTRDNVAEPFSVLNHGDSWNNNFMFQGTKKICLVDFQVIRMASPVLDLSYFFMSSTTKELRDKHFDEFIQIYYDNLAEIIRKCGSDPERLFSFSDLQNEFKKFGLYGVLLAPMLVNIVVTDPNDLLNMNEYSEQANLNNGTGDFVKENPITLEKIRDRLAGVIEDAIKYGWIDPWRNKEE